MRQIKTLKVNISRNKCQTTNKQTSKQKPIKLKSSRKKLAINKMFNYTLPPPATEIKQPI